MAKKHECNCKDCPHQRSGGGGSGFALGATLGAAAAAFLAPDKGEKTRRRAKQKFEQLTQGRSVDDIVAQVRKAADGVIADVKSAAEEGKQEAAKERRRILKDSPRKK